MPKKYYIAFHKPYGVLSQFTPERNLGGEDFPQRTLSDFHFPKGVYAAGRLDKDSEGLLILSNDGHFIQRLTNPKFEKKKVYWVQVEGSPCDDDFRDFRRGLLIQGKKTRPSQVRVMEGLRYPERIPPIRKRKTIPTTWIEVILEEGRNRQVRRMCAAIGFPCLRLIRSQVGDYALGELSSGQWKAVSLGEILKK